MIMSALLALMVPLHTLSTMHTWDLKREYRGKTFFDHWTFFVEPDPTHGFVNYIEKEYALKKGYIKYLKNSSVYIGTDYHNNATHAGRDSVRISTNDIFNYGLFIVQVAHIPEGCGTWPAFWALGNNGSNECLWPNCGELDIIEACNQILINTASLHTSEGCDSTGIPMDNDKVTGTQRGTNCYTNYPENLGCSWELGNNSFGSAFNKVGGGLYAFEWTEDDLSLWFWEKKNVPSNAQSMNPDPSTWGTPGAYWQFGYWCDATYLRDIKLILDLAFCGDWSGGIWYMGCAQATGDSDCAHFVKHNPKYFENAHWTIDFIRVFRASSDTKEHRNGAIIGIILIAVIVFVVAGLWFVWWKSKKPTAVDTEYMILDEEI